MIAADRTARRRLVALVATSATLPAACGGEKQVALERAASGALSRPAEVRLLQLREGDCVGNLLTALRNDDGAANGVPLVRAVPCSYLHDGEVLEIVPIEEKSYPGTQIIDGHASRGRLELQPRIDRARIRSGLRSTKQFGLLTFRPDDNRWDFENQREILYIALFIKPRRGRVEEPTS